jgi:hypothetical protein
MDNFSIFDRPEPGVNKQIGKSEGFAPRSNSQAKEAQPRISLTQAIFGGGQPVKKIEKIEKKEEKKEKLFNSSNSVEKMKAMPFMGGKIRENSTLMRRLGLNSTEEIKSFVSQATGKGPYFHSGTAKKDQAAFETGKFENVSYYKDASPKVQRALRDRETQKGLAGIYKDMHKK